MNYPEFYNIILFSSGSEFYRIASYIWREFFVNSKMGLAYLSAWPAKHERQEKLPMQYSS